MDGELSGTSFVGWEPALLNIFELWDVDAIGGNGPALMGVPLNKLVMEGKTGFVVVEPGGAGSTRNGTELQDVGSRTISRCSCI